MINIDFKADLERLSSKILNPDDFSEAVEKIKQLSLSIRRNVHIRPAMADFILDLKKQISQST